MHASYCMTSPPGNTAGGTSEHGVLTLCRPRLPSLLSSSPQVLTAALSTASMSSMLVTLLVSTVLDRYLYSVKKNLNKIQANIQNTVTAGYIPHVYQTPPGLHLTLMFPVCIMCASSLIRIGCFDFFCFRML